MAQCDLESCPFCGGAAQATPLLPSGVNIRVAHGEQCVIASMAGFRHPDFDVGVNAWNRRRVAVIRTK